MEFKEILERKIKHYGKTEAAYEFAAEEYSNKLIKEAQNEPLILYGVSISLLKKYMIHVENCEGVNFVSDIGRTWSEVEFTKEEIDYLQKLDKEINESNEC